ncbi:MAG: hypothetical protein ACUVWJ_11480 [Spirochaetota bacterium]
MSTRKQLKLPEEPFWQIEIKVELSADEGQIKISDYENRIEEALGQSGVNIEEGSKE